MKTILKYIPLLLTIILFSACKKSSTGGDAAIVVSPEHHGAPIKGATVYVKFKTSDLPSNPTTNYDLVVVGDPAEDHVHIEGLRYGQYYLYAVGYDSSIGEEVSGGTALTIKWKERRKEIHLDIAVVE